jgi:hypothetical protein
MHDDDEGKPTPDSDRAAILARRRQFIALALSGLATTTACTDGNDAGQDSKRPQPDRHRGAKPDPCLAVPLDYVPPPQPDRHKGAKPEPCLAVPLDYVPPPQPDSVPPQVCLKIAIPEPGGETGEALADEPPPPEPKPRPCLKKAIPKKVDPEF